MKYTVCKKIMQTDYLAIYNLNTIIKQCEAFAEYPIENYE